MRVFLTGGSGFIGGRLARALLAEGHEVICLARSERSSAALSDLGARVARGDLADPASLKRCVSEAAPTHVAHLAAEIATQRSAERIDRINVQGTRALVDACTGIPLERFLFLSTVVRGAAHGELFTEEDDIPTTTEYGRSKQRGEEIVLAAAKEQGLPAVILRPSHVYGPGGWLKELLEDRMFRIPGSGDNLWDVVHVDDVVSACMLLLARADAAGVYHVVDDEPVTMKQFFGHVAEALGRKPYGHAPVWLAKLIRGGGPVTAAVRGARSSNQKLKALGWRPAHPRSEAAIPLVVREIAAGAAGPRRS